jgi:hypothetical protein
MARRYLPAELTMCLTLQPFLHLGPRIAGAQAQSRCSPPRRNNLDRAPALRRAVRSDDCVSLPETTDPANVGLVCKASDEGVGSGERLVRVPSNTAPAHTLNIAGTAAEPSGRVEHPNGPCLVWKGGLCART